MKPTGHRSRKTKTNTGEKEGEKGSAIKKQTEKMGGKASTAQNL
jgi:hypothetical protein